MKSKKKVHVISIQDSYLNIIAYQLLEILGDVIDISALTIQQLTTDIIDEKDIVVLSKETLKGITRPFIPDSCPIIIASREINIVNTKELLLLPKGKHVLVVNDTMEHAEETAISLESIMFEHEYSAYDSIQPIPTDVEVIVTPGELSLVPKQFDNVIDIGPRVLDIKTVLEIVNCLDIEFGEITLMNRYFKSQVSISEKLKYQKNFQIEDSLKMQSNLQSFENNVINPDVVLTEKEIGAIIEKVEAHGFLKESIEILTIYKEGKENFESFGRTKVKLRLRDMGIHLTDQQLRLRMEVLQELELINARQGRGGAKISIKGELFLERNTDIYKRH